MNNTLFLNSLDVPEVAKFISTTSNVYISLINSENTANIGLIDDKFYISLNDKEQFKIINSNIYLYNYTTDLNEINYNLQTITITTANSIFNNPFFKANENGIYSITANIYTNSDSSFIINKSRDINYNNILGNQKTNNTLSLVAKINKDEELFLIIVSPTIIYNLSNIKVILLNYFY